MIFSRQHRSWLLAALLIIGLGFAVRMINLGGDSFWLDEIFTVRVVTLTPPNLVPRELDHPPLLHILARWSINLFGETEFGLRLPAALAGVLALPLLIAVGQRMARPQAGLWAALLLALSPFHLRYSQEARQYALLMTFSLAAFFWLYRIIEPDPKRLLKPLRSYGGHWLGFAAATVLNLYSHYGALVFLAVQAVIIAGWGVNQLRRRQWQRVGVGVAAASLTVLLYLPWLNRLQEDLTRNVGAGSQANSFNMASLGQGVQAGCYALGTTAGLMPYLMAPLFVGGFLIVVGQNSGDLALSGSKHRFATPVHHSVPGQPRRLASLYHLPVAALFAGGGYDAGVGTKTHRNS
ncbi:MAG: glycosyltransferase family 39 protein [Chloroflexi bacterium]|nr:glycosyltransferase family 39 protein [Chloroflexota bacterium]